MGIAILYAYVLADSVGEGLRQLRVDVFTINSDLYLVFPEHKNLSPVADHFREFVMERGAEILPMRKLEQQVERALSMR